MNTITEGNGGSKTSLGRDVNQGTMAKVEVTGDLERALRKFSKKVTDEKILSEYKKREHFVAKKNRKKRSKKTR